MIYHAQHSEGYMTGSSFEWHWHVQLQSLGFDERACSLLLYLFHCLECVCVQVSMVMTCGYYDYGGQVLDPSFKDPRLHLCELNVFHEISMLFKWLVCLHWTAQKDIPTNINSINERRLCLIGGKEIIQRQSDEMKWFSFEIF